MAGSVHNESVQISNVSAPALGRFTRIFSLKGLFLFTYTLSGVVALAYQVLWIRLLSIQFGVSVFSVAATAAAFMLGLGGGGLIGSYWVSRLRRPLLIIAVRDSGKLQQSRAPNDAVFLIAEPIGRLMKITRPSNVPPHDGAH